MAITVIFDDAQKFQAVIEKGKDHKCDEVIVHQKGDGTVEVARSALDQALSLSVEDAYVLSASLQSKSKAYQDVQEEISCASS